MVYLRDSQNSPRDCHTSGQGPGVLESQHHLNGAKRPCQVCSVSTTLPQLSHNVADTAMETIKPKPHTPEQWWLVTSEHESGPCLPAGVS